MSEFVVYRIVNSINGKEYIGSSINFKKRKSEHIRHLKANRHHCIYLQNAFNKYGLSNFSFEIIKHFDNKEDMLAYEELQLEDLGNKYNISKSSNGGDTISNHPNLDNIKLKHKLNYYKTKNESGNHPFENNQQKGELNPNWKGGGREKKYCLDCGKLKSRNGLRCPSCATKGVRNSFYGKKHTLDVRKKLSLLRGENPTNIQPIIVHGILYKSIKEASNILGLTRATITYRCKTEKYINYNFL